MLVGDRPVRVDAKASGYRDGVNIGAQEQELPVIFLLLALDEPADIIIGITPAGILITVCGNDKDGLFRAVLLPRVLMDITDMTDRVSHGVQQGSAAADAVLVSGHIFDLIQRHTVMQNRLMCIKENGGNESLSLFLSLLAEHAVEAADRIRLKPAHGAALVNDKNDFCKILSHSICLL